MRKFSAIILNTVTKLSSLMYTSSGLKGLVMSLVSLSQVCIVITSPLAVSICSGTTTTAGLGRLSIRSTNLLVGASGIVVGVVGTGTILLVSATLLVGTIVIGVVRVGVGTRIRVGGGT